MHRGLAGLSIETVQLAVHADRVQPIAVEQWRRVRPWSHLCIIRERRLVCEIPYGLAGRSIDRDHHFLIARLSAIAAIVQRVQSPAPTTIAENPSPSGRVHTRFRTRGRPACGERRRIAHLEITIRPSPLRPLRESERCSKNEQHGESHVCTSPCLDSFRCGIDRD